MPGSNSLKCPLTLGGIFLVYLFVAVVAYTDYPRQPTAPPLNELERDGLSVWRQQNCQACHQLYGFGGFLGPDLTNRITDDTLDDEVNWILEGGSGRMPALRLSLDDQEAVLEFLRAVNRTGQSQPTPLASRGEVLDRDHCGWLAREWAGQNGYDLAPTVGHGIEVWEKYGCGACHVPFTIGDNLAPDLTRSACERSMDAVSKLLKEGRGRMPSSDVTPAELKDLCAFLEWFADHRTELVELNERLLDREPFSWRDLPWFEYR